MDQAKSVTRGGSISHCDVYTESTSRRDNYRKTLAYKIVTLLAVISNNVLLIVISTIALGESSSKPNLLVYNYLFIA